MYKCINDLVNSDFKAIFLLFADDTALFCTNKFIKQLKADVYDSLKNIANWLKPNKPTLDVYKSNLLFFDTSINLGNKS